MTSTRLAASLVFLSLLFLVGCGAAVDRKAGTRERAAEARYPPLGQFVEVNGRRVHYIAKGRGPDLVLIHGASGNMRDFTFSFMDELTDRFRVIVFDRPGLGYTDRASDRYGGALNTSAESPAEQAVLLQAAAAKLGARRPIVLGQSYGGAVAMAWALERPRNVAALVIVSGATMPWEGSLSPTYPLLSSRFGGTTVAPLVAASFPQDRARLSVGAIFAPQAAPAGYMDYIGVGLATRRDTLLANARQVNTLKGHLERMAPRYPSVRVPVELVHGTSDLIVGYEIHSVKLAALLPDARLTPLPGIGHMPHHSAEATVIALVDRAARRAGLR